MSFKATFTCDFCRIIVEGKYNGEHWLPPIDWVELLDSQTVRVTGQHLCGKCRPKIKTKVKK